MISKPRCFLDLLELQKILDDKVSKPRENGFEPRSREELDILLSVDDEIQEWCRELPSELNFKTWKQKEYNREKELEELTDILFFFLQYFNYHWMILERLGNEVDRNYFNDKLVELTTTFDKPLQVGCKFKTKLYSLKHCIWSDKMAEAFKVYLDIALTRGFNTNDLLETYWEKWQTNMKRINEDWVIHE